jgi:phage baseplate assembly protein gpV
MAMMVPLVEAVVRRELTAHRGLSLGVVTAVATNSSGDGTHHLDASVRLHGGDLELQHVPVAVARPGWSTVPRVDDLVVVGFVDGDANGGIILGVLHHADAPSPTAAADEVVYAVPDSGGDARRLALLLPNGNEVVVADEQVTVSMGGTSLVVSSGGDVTIDAQGDVSIVAAGALSLEGGSGASLKGPTVDVEASGAAKLKGATTTVAGAISFSAG